MKESGNGLDPGGSADLGLGGGRYAEVYFSADTYFKNGIEGTGYDISKGFQASQGEITAAVIFKLK